MNSQCSRRRDRGLTGGALLIAALMLGRTHAALAGSTSGTSDALAEVLVTAQRRAEPILDVPASISVITAADLERLHATNLRDLEALAPGFAVVPTGGSPGQAQIVIRGLPSLAGASVVATIIDDAPVGSSSAWADGPGFALDLLPYDIERIEILHGPQGTLYGANSMGGVLKYVTRDPSLTTREAQIGGEAFAIKAGGSVGTGVRGTWSDPLIEGTLAVRASLYDQETPGYIKNPTRGLSHENALSEYGGRLALLWQPAADLQVKLQAIYQGRHAAGNAIIFADVLGTPHDPYYRPGTWYYRDLLYPHPVPEPFSGDLTFVSGALVWQTPLGELVAVSSYSDKGVSQTQDLTDVYLAPSIPVRLLFDTGSRKFSQEIRLASRSGQRLDWLVGAFYTHERAWSNAVVDALDQQLDPLPGMAPYAVGSSPSNYDEAAIFGTSTVKITERVDVTGGLRWLTNRQEVDSYTPPSYTNPDGLPAAHVRSAETPGIYSLNARYRPRPEAMIYVRVASGYRPGTPNPPAPGYPEIPPLATSDTMVSYETGVKSYLWDRGATLDLDVFKIRWSNMQIGTFTPDGRVGYAINGGDVTSKGCEFTATYRLGTELHFGANAAYTDAFATQAVPAVGIYPGARLPSSPKWTAAATFDYRLPDLHHWAPNISATWRYVSSVYNTISTAPPPVGLIPAYSLVSADLTLTRGRYELSLYAKNLFDVRTFNNGGVGGGPPGATFVFAGFTVDPRIIGLSASMTL